MKPFLLGMPELAVANPRDRDLAELAKRQAAAPLRPRQAQAPCDVGLFSDQRDQVDLVDLARRASEE